MWQKIMDGWLKICSFHRTQDSTAAGTFVDFFIPRFNRFFMLRLAIVAVLAVIIFRFFLLPCVINGESMAPTFNSKGFTFCWRGQYWFKQPARGDIVIIKYADRVFFLKRIVGLPGDKIAFVNGDLIINGKKQNEPYVKFVSYWNLPEREVEPNHYYVVGDNRSQDIDVHRFGQVSRSKIIGSPLW